MSLIVRFWKDVEFSKTDLSTIGLGGLRHWSEMIGAEGDPRFRWNPACAGPVKKVLLQAIGQKPEDFLGLWGWIKKVVFWKKRVLLEVEGAPGTNFAVGFYDAQLNLCKISMAVRNIDDGPFLMRVGPSNIHFFVVAETKVVLRSRESFYATTRQPSEMGLLRHDLY